MIFNDFSILLHLLMRMNTTEQLSTIMPSVVAVTVCSKHQFGCEERKWKKHLPLLTEVDQNGFERSTKSPFFLNYFHTIRGLLHAVSCTGVFKPYGIQKTLNYNWGHFVSYLGHVQEIAPHTFLTSNFHKQCTITSPTQHTIPSISTNNCQIGTLKHPLDRSCSKL